MKSVGLAHDLPEQRAWIGTMWRISYASIISTRNAIAEALRIALLYPKSAVLSYAESLAKSWP